MILGVYWYFKFPENLYSFHFFKFSQGLGGHANNPAELVAKVSVNHPENLLNKLKELHLRFSGSYLNIKVNENQCMISIGDYQLFDYHFQLVSEIEKLLIDENAVSLDISFEAKSTVNFTPEQKKFENIEYRFIQLTGSDFKKNNAENFSIRIDFNLPSAHKKDFINDLIEICIEENIHVLYYFDRDFYNHCNLMAFFTNGRQTENTVQQVAINSFGKKINHLNQKYPFHFGFFGGMERYPFNDPHPVLMIDEEYILNKKENQI